MLNDNNREHAGDLRRLIRGLIRYSTAGIVDVRGADSNHGPISTWLMGATLWWTHSSTLTRPSRALSLQRSTSMNQITRSGERFITSGPKNTAVFDGSNESSSYAPLCFASSHADMASTTRLIVGSSYG